MPIFESVITEYGPGTYAGHIYGTYGKGTRVLMRSPTAVMMIGYGIHLIRRGTQHDSTVARDSRARGGFSQESIKLIDIIFGEGAAEQALKAVNRRGTGTVLVDGGGEPLPAPEGVMSAKAKTQHEEITPTASIAIDAIGCRQCSAALKPLTVYHNLASSPSEDHPKTIEDCQRLTNLPVVAIRGFEMNKPREWWPYVAWFETWDGESYIDAVFCNDRCSAEYGRRAAQSFPPLDADNSKVDRNRRGHESVNHYEIEDRELKIGDHIFKI